MFISVEFIDKKILKGIKGCNFENTLNKITISLYSIESNSEKKMIITKNFYYTPYEYI